MGLLTYARNAARTCAASDSPLPADSAFSARSSSASMYSCLRTIAIEPEYVSTIDGDAGPSLPSRTLPRIRSALPAKRQS